MKITFSKIVNNNIFENDFAKLSEQNGTICFKKKNGAGGIAVIYAPNGTGKTSLTSVLSLESSEKQKFFEAEDENGTHYSPQNKAFHIIQDQISRNVIRGKTTDYLIGPQIRREYELKEKIKSHLDNAYNSLASIYKKDFNITKVKDFFITDMEKSTQLLHKRAIVFIRSIINAKQHGKDITLKDFVLFVRNEDNKPCSQELDAEKRLFLIHDLSKAQVVKKVLDINPNEIIANENVGLVEQHDDAIHILEKYQELNKCVVCDNDEFNGIDILNQKKENRKIIYENLDEKTKEILDKVVRDDSLISSDPFRIKATINDFIAQGNSENIILLQNEIKEYIASIEDELINVLCSCFDDTDFYKIFDEHEHLIESQPHLDSEELKLIEIIVNENIGKEITIIRDKENDNNYRLKIGNKDLLGIERKDMELSTGEQNFISLSFELLLAKHSNCQYVVLDDPISSFDSIYKNKIAYCIVKFLEDKRQIILTHNTDLIRLLEVQLDNCFNLYLLNNVDGGKNGFIPISDREKRLLINLHSLVSLFQNKNNELINAIKNKRQFLMAMIPFLRGYAHISYDPKDYYGQLSDVMHGYNNGSVNVALIYNSLFGPVFEGEEIVRVSDILTTSCENLNIIDREAFPLLSDTLEQSFIYYHLRMKVEKELVEICNIRIDNSPTLSQIIQRAFNCNRTDHKYQEKTEFKVFFTSKKTLLNEFNHFEGNMNIFQPAIDITKAALNREIEQINAKLDAVKDSINS